MSKCNRFTQLSPRCKHDPHECHKSTIHMEKIIGKVKNLCVKGLIEFLLIWTGYTLMNIAVWKLGQYQF